MINKFMEAALTEARKALKEGNVPIGAAVVRGGQIISAAHNGKYPLMHAEKLAIERACETLNAKSLSGCDIFVTLEPCPMCAGAILLSGIDNVYFGAYDSRYGACQSMDNMFARYKSINKVGAYGGLHEDKCRDLILGYFKEKRKKDENEEKETQG